MERPCVLGEVCCWTGKSRPVTFTGHHSPAVLAVCPQRTDCKAVISTVEGSTLDSSGFSLRVGLTDAHLPRMWVEKHPEKESEVWSF